MADRPRKVLICSCEDTMPLDASAVASVCPGADIVSGRYLCRAELERFTAASASAGDIIVACTQEAPLFNEVAGESEKPPALTFVNIRETAGWSNDAKSAAPKMAALIAAAAEPMPQHRLVTLESSGRIVIYAHDASAIETAELIKDALDVTVLFKSNADIPPPRVTNFPVFKGTVRSAKGHLGAFELIVDNQASAAPSSRESLTFGPPAKEATLSSDLLLDISGGPPLFPAADLREGYLRADPGDPSAVLRALLKARDLVGTFEKPQYINFTESLCAHSRSQRVGCHRCLDLCPTGAITPNGDHIAINAEVCAGCGQCAAACPTGAAAYALPSADALMRKIRTLLSAYRNAGGKAPVLLLHDEEHGGALIDALARHGDGLPANVLPLAVNESTQVGLEVVSAAFAYGACAVRFLLRAKPRHDVTGLRNTLAWATPILTGLGFAVECIDTIETNDPFVLGEALRTLPRLAATDRPATFMAVGGKRDVMRLALRELYAVAPAPVDVISLPAGAPFGTIEVNIEGCTLCLSCVSACPTGALSDDPERPMLRFAEDACVQCGLCKATCPEKVISLKPQINFHAATSSARIIKQEEPFLCIRCGTPFGVKSSVERVYAQLEGKHWMFTDSRQRLDAIKMCADCRVAVMAEDNFDPLAGSPRPAVRTSDDYLREREANKADGQS
ncbi:MAG: Iron-sulfur cluster-binding protein [Pseudolabrys sp.]|jgi:ferredoxin|nr:Iron-sulfur cluster-binding protein [Pseudolabrys sp.]